MNQPMNPISEASSTVDKIEDAQRTHRILDAVPLWVASLFLFGLVAASAQGSAETSAVSGPWKVSLSYALITRAGQPAPLQFEVRRTTPIDSPVTLRVCGTWFDSMDFQNWYPNPASETRSSDTLVYEFDAPNSRNLTIAFDGRSSPGELGASLPCRVTLSSGSAEIFAATIKTWRMP